MKYVVFVDFDGVLTSTRVHLSYEATKTYPVWCVFDPVAIEFFNRLHYKYEDVSFVWTTTWRNGMTDKQYHTEHWAYAMWYNAGFRGKFGTPWRVNPDETIPLHKRAEEVKHYLEKYAPTARDYLVFDDNDYGFNDVLGKRRFIKTDSDNGLMYKHMKNVLSIVGTWDEK